MGPIRLKQSMKCLSDFRLNNFGKEATLAKIIYQKYQGNLIDAILKTIQTICTPNFPNLFIMKKLCFLGEHL